MYEDLELVPAANVDTDTVSETLDELTFECLMLNMTKKLNKTKGN